MKIPAQFIPPLLQALMWNIGVLAPAAAQISGSEVMTANPFETFLCPVIGLVRNYGIAAVIVFVLLLAMVMYMTDKGGEDKGIISIIKVAGLIIVGFGLLLVLYFVFEDWIIQTLGVSLCAGELG